MQLRFMEKWMNSNNHPLKNCLPGTELLQSPCRTEFSMGSLLQRYRRFLRSYRRSLRRCRNPWGDRRPPMLIFARLTKNRKTLLNVVKHHETLVKHSDTSWNVVKHREPLVKYHETLAIRFDNIGARCRDIDTRRCNIGTRTEFPAISARSFWRYRRLRSWYNSTDVQQSY